MKLRQILEAFTDIGNKSKQIKGQRLNKSDTNNFIEVNGNDFYKIISVIRSNDIAKKDDAKGLETLTLYSKNEYNEMRCFVGKNNSSGYAIHEDELVSVFSVQGSSGSAIVHDAIRNGAKRLDCFATKLGDNFFGQLYSLYSRNGFSIDTTLNAQTPYVIKNGVSVVVNESINESKRDKNDFRKLRRLKKIKNRVKLKNNEELVVIYMKH